ncbi:MAG TPA: diaminopropionate ammonia-lyase [Gammaproteobacteria bacterium]|nr:diaminopropionate ammonia-lyase [Gammaproteobacteria bacterium]
MSLPEVSISQSHHNTAALVGQACPTCVNDVLDTERCRLARDTISQWASYESTSLHSLEGLASEIGIGALYYKDESTRFGLGSFKALGGAYAVQHVLRQALDVDVPNTTVSLDDINTQRFANKVKNITVVTATDGNHGRSVAWGAQRFGCQCMIYMHENVSRGRQEAVEAFGAKVVRVAGNYDDSVRQADHDAKANGWHIVSDTSYPGYMEIPRDVMAGYTLMTTEAMNLLPEGVIPTHVFIQGGCGGLAGAVGADLWHRYGDKMPHLTVVEPVPAACLYESARAGAPQLVNIIDESLMAGLSCGEVSLLGWQILKSGARHFLTISDAPVAPLMKLLATGASGDPAIVAGESAIAGLAGLIGALGNESLAHEMNLNESSRVLVFGTEGATDPDVFEALVGTRAEHIAP